MSSKKRKRSEVSEASSEELSTVSTKRSREIEWTVPRDINTEVGLLVLYLELNFVES